MVKKKKTCYTNTETVINCTKRNRSNFARFPSIAKGLKRHRRERERESERVRERRVL